MLNFKFLNYFTLTPFIVSLYFIWNFFIKNNFYYVRISPGHSDVLKNSNFLKKLNYNFFTYFFIWLFFLFLNFLFFFRVDFFIYWFNHLKLNNFLIFIIYLIILVSFFILFVIKFYKNNNINFNIDYFFALFNLCIFIPSLYLCNTMYTFIFFLEINSILILYKFSVSKYFFLNPKNNLKNNFYKNTPKLFINMVFFQYWINFFSSVVLFFSIFNILFLIGTTDWFFINIMNYYNSLFYNNYVLFFLVYFIFLISMFVKIGFTPSHLFKIEVYKGLPFMSILFYTVFYFISFFLFFTLIFFYYLHSIKIFIWFFLFIVIVFGLFYILSLLFDVNLIKNFFAYSTVINSLTFIILLFVSLN